MLEIRSAGDGIIFKVKVQPKASADKIAGVHDGMLRMSVSAVPEHGKATESVIKLLSRHLHIAKTNIEIIAGISSRIKTIRITGAVAEDIIALTKQHQ